VVSVPIDVTEAVIAELGPRVRADALLMDVTSVKAAPVAAMLAATERSGAGVVGAHPMFGPGVHTLQGQRVVLCRGRGDAWCDWAAAAFAARGLAVTEADPERHDRAMAVVQVLTHFQTQVYGAALARLEGALGLSLGETLGFTSPAYLLELWVAARHFAQSPALYGPIEMRNPHAAAVTGAFRDAAAEVAAVIAAGDQDGFARLFDEVRAFFGAFADEAASSRATSSTGWSSGADGRPATPPAAPTPGRPRRRAGPAAHAAAAATAPTRERDADERRRVGGAHP
jgi:prephenate dehydrogenase